MYKALRLFLFYYVILCIRLLAPASKKSSFDKKERFFEKKDYSLDDVYRCLSFFDRQKENLPVWLNDKIKENYGRDASLIYYDVTNYYFESDGQNDFLSKDYLFDYYDEVLKDIGAALGIDVSKRIRTLGEVKKFWQVPFCLFP